MLLGPGRYCSNGAGLLVFGAACGLAGLSFGGVIIADITRGSPLFGLLCLLGSVLGVLGAWYVARLIS